MKGRYAPVFVFFLVLLFAGVNRDSKADDLVVQTGFDVFCKKWLDTLKSKGCYTPEQPCRIKDTSNPGVIITGYSSIEKVVSMTVKKTSVQRSPYVGILKYSVLKYCLEEETNRFKPCGRQSVTEIFSYRNGTWTY